MKKLKIKLEYNFNVPDDTEIRRDDWHGLFILNKKYSINSKPDMRGLKIKYQKFDKRGMLEEASMTEDGCILEDFLYNGEESEMVSEKTTIYLGDEKHQYNI
jgi:hypothetical protein